MTKTFSRLLASGALAVSAIAALPASAAPLLYTFTSTNASYGNFSFNIDSNPAPTDSGADAGFVADITNGTGTYISETDASFYSFDNGGGIGSLFGPQLYSGSEDAPTLLTGNFTLLTSNESTVAGNLAVTSAVAAAVPEPAAWAMMILGVGMVGGFMRRRIRASEVAFDAKVKRIASGEALA